MFWIVNIQAYHVPHTAGQVRVENGDDDKSEDFEAVEKYVLSDDSVLSLGRFEYLLEYSVDSALVEEHVNSG